MILLADLQRGAFHASARVNELAAESFYFRGIVVFSLLLRAITLE